MINNLISQLKEEALEDAEHKDLCDTELTTNTQARKEKTATVENLHATVNELKTSMENSVLEVTKLSRLKKQKQTGKGAKQQWT